MLNAPLLRVEELHKHFALSRKTRVHAVNGVSFELEKGEAVGLVGESGCGKSTIARCIVWLEKLTSGRILFQGRSISELSARQFRPMRRHLQMVFQDPTMSLNPLLTVRQTLREPLQVHRIASSEAEIRHRVERILEFVKLEQRLLDRHPRQLSGGQKQRVGIARALISDPELVILDEPTSSLDMSIRIHIIGLLKDLQEKLGITYLFISHDLSTVRSLCSRVLVMYLGQLVESGPVEEIFDRPLHFYTRALLSAIPIPDPKIRRQRIILQGEPPSLTKLPRGCAFGERCGCASDSCREQKPLLQDVGGGHFVACQRV